MFAEPMKSSGTFCWFLKQDDVVTDWEEGEETTLVAFLVTGLKKFAFFFVPGVARESPISTRSKTVEHCNGVGSQPITCNVYVVFPPCDSGSFSCAHLFLLQSEVW